jgi:hypothetical protein
LRWDSDGAHTHDVASPEWAPGERRREEPGERIARWCVEQYVEPAIGNRAPGRMTKLFFRSPRRTRIDEVLEAARGGASIEESPVPGGTMFRFRLRGVLHGIRLTDDEAATIRVAIAELKSP